MIEGVSDAQTVPRAWEAEAENPHKHGSVFGFEGRSGKPAAYIHLGVFLKVGFHIIFFAMRCILLTCHEIKVLVCLEGDFDLCVSETRTYVR